MLGRSGRRGAGRLAAAHTDLLYVGLNCATGSRVDERPSADPLRAESADPRRLCAERGTARTRTVSTTRARTTFERIFSRFLRTRAGSTWSVAAAAPPTGHVKAALAELVVGTHRPRKSPAAHHQSALVSGLEAVELTEDNRPLLVGERTNVLGSRKFKRLIAAGEFEAGAESRSRSGARRCSGHRRLPPGPRSRRDRRHRGLPRSVSIRHGQGAADDRLDRRRGDGAGSDLLSGQVDPQLDQSGGRRSSASRRSCRWRVEVRLRLVVGLIDEQGMAVSCRAQARGGRRSFRDPDRGLRACRRRTSGGMRWSSRVAPVTRTTSARRPRPSRACAQVKRVSRPPRRFSVSRTSASGCPTPGARCSTRSSSITAPRPGSTRRSSTPRSWLATPRFPGRRATR